MDYKGLTDNYIKNYPHYKSDVDNFSKYLEAD